MKNEEEWCPMLRHFEDLLHKISALLILVIGIVIVTNVIVRSVFSTQIPDSIIIIPELMVAMILLPLAAATRERAHIVVELVSRQLPERLQGWLVVMGSVVGLLAVGILFYAGYHDLEKMISRQSTFAGEFELPKWPGVAAYVAGFGFAALRLAVMIVNDTLACLRGDVAELIAPHDEAKDIENEETV